MKFEKVIDLSHRLQPGREARRFEIERLKATHITGADAEPDWYIMHRLIMDNHIGTHLEVPYHCLPDGDDLAQLPIEQFIGTAVILDLRGFESHKGIPLKDVQAAAEKAGGIHQGDIVFCMTGWSQYYGTEEYINPPFLTGEAVRWVVDQDIKMLGVDTMGAMDPSRPDRQNHLPLFEAGLVYVENLTNLERVPQSRVTVAALPPAIEGLEAINIRVIALV